MKTNNNILMLATNKMKKKNIPILTKRCNYQSNLKHKIQNKNLFLKNKLFKIILFN